MPDGDIDGEFIRSYLFAALAHDQTLELVATLERRVTREERRSKEKREILLQCQNLASDQVLELLK
jgi:hypothetical protein